MWRTGFCPIQGFTAGPLNTQFKGFAQGGLLLFADRPGVGRDEEHAAAIYHRLQPLPALGPGHVWGEGNTVGIERVERLVLRHAKGECVDADAAGPLPLFSADVVAGSRSIENSHRQVADGIAAKDDALFSAACTETAIQGGYDFSIGQRAIVEMPIPLGG